MSNFTSASASFLLDVGGLVLGRGSIGFRVLTVNFEKGTVVGYGIY